MWFYFRILMKGSFSEHSIYLSRFSWCMGKRSNMLNQWSKYIFNKQRIPLPFYLNNPVNLWKKHIVTTKWPQIQYLGVGVPARKLWWNSIFSSRENIFIKVYFCRRHELIVCYSISLPETQDGNYLFKDNNVPLHRFLKKHSDG